MVELEASDGTLRSHVQVMRTRSGSPMGRWRITHEPVKGQARVAPRTEPATNPSAKPIQAPAMRAARTETATTRPLTGCIRTPRPGAGDAVPTAARAG